MGGNREKGLGHLRHTRQQKVLDILAGQNHHTISLSHPLHGVADIGNCCGVGEEYMKFLKNSSGISS